MLEIGHKEYTEVESGMKMVAVVANPAISDAAQFSMQLTQFSYLLNNNN